VRSDYVAVAVVETAQTPVQFLQRVESLLLSDNQERTRRGMEIARENTWDRRIEQIKTILGHHLVTSAVDR